MKKFIINSILSFSLLLGGALFVAPLAQGMPGKSHNFQLDNDEATAVIKRYNDLINTLQNLTAEERENRLPELIEALTERMRLCLHQHAEGQREAENDPDAAFKNNLNFLIQLRTILEELEYLGFINHIGVIQALLTGLAATDATERLIAILRQQNPGYQGVIIQDRLELPELPENALLTAILRLYGVHFYPAEDHEPNPHEVALVRLITAERPNDYKNLIEFQKITMERAIEASVALTTILWLNQMGFLFIQGKILNRKMGHFESSLMTAISYQHPIVHTLLKKGYRTHTLIQFPKGDASPRLCMSHNLRHIRDTIQFQHILGLFTVSILQSLLIEYSNCYMRCVAKEIHTQNLIILGTQIPYLALAIYQLEQTAIREAAARSEYWDKIIALAHQARYIKTATCVTVDKKPFAHNATPITASHIVYHKTPVIDRLFNLPPLLEAQTLQAYAQQAQGFYHNHPAIQTTLTWIVFLFISSLLYNSYSS